MDNNAQNPLNQNDSFQPELVLDPIPAPAPALVLTPEPAGQALPAQAAAQAIEDRLSPQELEMVQEFAKKIDIANATQVLQYGVGAQQKISSFSETALSSVRGKDLGEVGDMITGLVTELKNFSPEEERKGFLGLFKKGGNQMTAFQAKYSSVAKNVDRISDQLEGHKLTLLKDVAMLDKMYEMNLAYYKELTMYILAGRRKLEEVTATHLPALQRKARETGLQEDAQSANNLAEMCNRFEKKLHDLELTRTISIQMAPQIRLVQNNNSVMIDKIQSSIVNTIPLWKNQMVLSLGLAHSKNAIEAQRQVTDITNQLLRKNADTLKQSTVETARESERGIVDIETLQYTNQSLISTLDEVLQIQQEGRDKRFLAEAELRRIEDELKNKLLEVRDTTRGKQNQ